VLRVVEHQQHFLVAQITQRLSLSAQMRRRLKCQRLQHCRGDGVRPLDGVGGNLIAIGGQPCAVVALDDDPLDVRAAEIEAEVSAHRRSAVGTNRHRR